MRFVTTGITNSHLRGPPYAGLSVDALLQAGYNQLIIKQTIQGTTMLLHRKLAGAVTLPV
jgi:hypothetical protein